MTERRKPKRIMAIFLCLVILLTNISIPAKAKERTLYQLKVNAGNGELIVPSFVEDGEIYVPAHDFENFTRYEYHEKENMFLVKVQEEDKAFKKVKFNPENKKMAIGSKVLDLTGCIVENENVYLPLAQMLPILNAEILGIAGDTMYISNNELSMAELLYDFDITDYCFNLKEEFYNDLFLAGMYIVPSYLFDTVVNRRYDRVDLLMESGRCSDYKAIFKEYLKDNKLFQEAIEEKDQIGDVLETTTGINSKSKMFYDVYEWFEYLYEMELESDSIFEFDDVEKLLREGYLSELFEEEFKQILDLSYGELTENGPSAAELIEGLEFIYSFMTQVEDHTAMLNAVYDIKEKKLAEEERKSIPGASAGFFATNPEYLAAEQVYDLYQGDITKETIQKLTEEVTEKILEGHDAYEVANWYKITAKLAGEIIELFMPGDSRDRAVLTNHVDIINSTLGKATVPDLTTEESTSEYRLSLLLAMIASRKCYSIMEETADGYGQDTTYYKNKIEKIENLIKGLYIVAENERFDTYENYEQYKNDNQKKIEKSEIISNMKKGVVEILIEWDGKTEKDNKLFNLDFVISLDDRANNLEWDGNEGYSKDGELICTYTKKTSKNKGEIRILLYDTEGTYSIEGQDGDFTPSEWINEISIANAKATITDLDGNRYSSSSDKDFYRSYTGFWFWGICTIEAGKAVKYDASWIEEVIYNFQSMNSQEIYSDVIGALIQFEESDCSYIDGYYITEESTLYDVTYYDWFKGIYYSYYDIDDNGVEELIIGAKCEIVYDNTIYIYDIWTYDGNEPYKFSEDMYWGHYDKCTIASNGYIYVDWYVGDDSGDVTMCYTIDEDGYSVREIENFSERYIPVELNWEKL